MTAQPHQPLSRLFIPPPISHGFADTAPTYSPGLPTAIHQGIHPPYGMNVPNPMQAMQTMQGMPPLQTPMQPAFFPQPPGAPGRPTLHRSHPSVAQLAAAGILPPGIPVTPLGQNGFHFGPMQPFGGQPFMPRNKRSLSVSVGGPPKAVLGGPQRKVSPLPAPAAVIPPPAPVVRPKKVIVNFPRESVPEEARPSWARTPLFPVPEQPDVQPPELASAEQYPPDEWRLTLPNTVDVFLPGKSAWDDMRRTLIEERLEKLGVERGSGSIPNIHAPHARAASISSPADPALLYFKLNKLQQSQNASGSNSLSSSPHLNSSPSPSQLPPRLQNRHGHSMSLAQPPSFQSHSPVYNPAGAFNPFGPTATLGSDQMLINRLSPAPIPSLDNIHAPQGRVPANFSTLAPPQASSRPESRPDFFRGFGLDVTEEEEEPMEDVPAREGLRGADSPSVAEAEEEEEEEEVYDATEAAKEEYEDLDQDGVSTVAQSRIHSRHVSRLSAALSLRSVGGMAGGFTQAAGVALDVVPSLSPSAVEAEDLDQDPDQDAVGEWTGSEDLRTGAETSEDESIGEWSNPSDEERARQHRVERRMLRRTKQEDPEVPRRIPKFPIPPVTQAVKDDDIVSNPSEEDHAEVQEAYLGLGKEGYHSRPGSNLSGKVRPLPPLPNSRPGSAPYSYHDPALAHSRETSVSYFQPGGIQSRPPQSQTAPLPRRDSLNPFAKPFVFGANSSGQTTSSNQAPVSAPVLPSSFDHERTASFGKPLNAAAQEFKPSFTFRPPPGVPQLAFGAEASRPLPVPPDVVPRAQQGREKRQRRVSSGSYVSEDEDGVNTMSSFKFPPSADNTKVMRHSAPSSPPQGLISKEMSLNAGAKPFNFSGFSTLPSISQQANVLSQSPVSDEHDDEDEGDDENKPLEQSPTEPESALELPFPPTSKPKRAPIPLDFKHPVSTNTVPAGLFRSLANGDGEERTRRGVRSRLSSRDIFEHSPHQSLDDLNVPTISRRVSKSRLFTDPGLRDSPLSIVDVFSADRRRSSLPPRHREDSSLSDISIPPVNLTRRLEMHQYEQRLEELLDEKLEFIKRTLMDVKQASSGSSLNPSTENMISEVVSLFRTQLQESATRGLADSEMDARGELDFEVLKGIIEQSHAETRALMQRDLFEILRTHAQEPTMIQRVEELSHRTVNAVVSATSQLAVRMQTMDISRSSPQVEMESIVHELMNLLVPQLAALRPEPIDYEGLTAQLTQAVKPHISQLIDLASDKRETAGLIVDSLIPILSSLHAQTPPFDTETIVGRLTTEVRKIVAPLDAHEIKEQVSDLVVERLDSRLAMRDKAFNVDVLSEKVVDSICDLLAPVQEIQSAVNALVDKQGTSSEPALASVKEDILGVLSDLPQRLVAATEALNVAQAEVKKQTEDSDQVKPIAKNIQDIQAALGNVTREQQKLASQNQEFSDFCQDIIKHINTLPEAMVEATSILQNAHADFAARDTSQKDAEEIRRLMVTAAELQVQLAKARAAHGQVRVEKDIIMDRFKTSEAEREHLISKVEELQNSLTNKNAEVVTTELKNAELEEALANALDRLKAADVQAQIQHDRIAQVEKGNHELALENQQFKSQAEALDLRVVVVSREKESLVEELANQRRQYEDLALQQSHWDDLRHATEQIHMLSTLMGQADNEELKELKYIRDRSKVLEGEHSALQRRLKEYENKMVSSEKMAQASRQSLAQAQQRAVEWERLTKEYESDLEATRSKLDEVQQAHSQLDGDYSMAKMQLEERDAEERLDKDRQSKLRDQIAALEGQVARLQAEVDQAKKAVTSAPPARYQQNGHAHPVARPESRASTVYSRAGTPPASFTAPGGPTARATTPRQSSIWDSMHAPKNQVPIRLPVTPKAQRLSPFYRSEIPSPTPSNVSAAPTLGNDGWWE